MTAKEPRTAEMPCGAKLSLAQFMNHIPQCEECSDWVVNNVPPRRMANGQLRYPLTEPREE